jgi:Uma2 family endonuclease
MQQYFKAGVKEVWLIDPDTREVEVWTGPSLPDKALAGSEAVSSSLLPGFSLTLDELFA